MVATLDWGYLLAQGPASGLVCSPTQWPGASSTRALLDDLRVPATYVSLDKQRRNAALANPRPVGELAEDVSFELTPLLAWTKLTADARRVKVAALVDAIETEHKGKTFMGARAPRTQSPHRAPRRPKRSAMPRCHASSGAARRRYGAAYREFRNTYLRAAHRLRHDRAASRTEIHRLYPPGSLARPAWYIPTPANFQLPWRAVPRTPTDPPSRPDGHLRILLAPTRHHHPLPPITACSPAHHPAAVRPAELRVRRSRDSATRSVARSPVQGVLSGCDSPMGRPGPS